MPTNEERISTLEQAVANLQAEILAKPDLGQVKTITQAVETRLDTNDTEHTSYSDRLDALDRYFTSLRSAIQGLNEDGQAIKRNLIATTAPTVNDDASSGYSVGSDWFDTTADDAYVCLDATTGAAVWKKTTP